MAGNIQNVRIGDAEVYLDGVHQGHTKGGVELSFEREIEDLTVDQHGTSPVELALTGHNLTVKAFFAEIVPDRWKSSVPEAGTSGNVVGFGTDSGELFRQHAKTLRLHPRNKPANDYTEDVTIWLAVSVENVEQAYKIDEQRVFETTFRALIDDTKGDGFRLGIVGGQAIS